MSDWGELLGSVLPEGGCWYGLQLLFLASVCLLAQYGAQRVWLSHGHKAGARACPANQSSPQLSAALSWLLSLQAWRGEWQSAWVSALNRAAAKHGSSFQLAIDRVGPHRSELSLSQVNITAQSEQHLVMGCHVTGECAQFSISVTQESPAAMRMESFNVQVSPLHAQLEVHLQEIGDIVQVTWSLVNCQSLSLNITPRVRREGSEGEGTTDLETIHTLLRDMLTSAQPTVILNVKAGLAKGIQASNSLISQDLLNPDSSLVSSPPKPPRAHERKLLVKILKVDALPVSAAAGRTSTARGFGASSFGEIRMHCVIGLDNPLQKVSSSTINTHTSTSLDQQFVFELSGKSRKLRLQLVEDLSPYESVVLGEVTVPIDLIKKQPNGRQSFRLSSVQRENNSGSITAEFSYMEPGEVKSRQMPMLLPARKVEKDRTVMPCGTVITTVTAVRTKPRADSKFITTPTDSPTKSPAEGKEAEQGSSAIGERNLEAPVSKALSSSDTELMLLNGADPVAEAAIRQLTESSRHKLKSPVRKSTIIISGIAKTTLPYDNKMTLWSDYAATMDATLRPDPLPVALERVVGSEPTCPSDPTQEESLPSSAEQLAVAEPVRGDGEEACAGEEEEEEDGMESKCNNGSLEDVGSERRSSVSVHSSETGSVKKPRGGFMRSGPKFFFRRRHRQKDPGMSQSHNDLVFLEQPTPLETERKSARKHRKKLFSKSKNKVTLNGSALD